MDEHRDSCCWCGSSQLPDDFGRAVTKADSSEEVSAIKQLLSLAGISSSMLQENEVYQLCKDCIEIVSRGSDLKSELYQVLHSPLAVKAILGQLKLVKMDLQRRTRFTVTWQNQLTNTGDETKFSPPLGLLFYRCFFDCVVQLRPGDQVSATEWRSRSTSTIEETPAKIEDLTKPWIEHDASCEAFDDMDVKFEPSQEQDMYNELTSAYSSEAMFEVTRKRKLNSLGSPGEVFPNDSDLMNSIEQDMAVDDVEQQDLEREMLDESSASYSASNVPVSSPTSTRIQEMFGIDPNEEIYECVGCQDTFKTMKAKLAHEYLHKVNRKTYKCGMCCEKFSTYEDLKLHRQQHFVYPCACDDCGLILRTEDSLREHAKEHNPAFKFKCSVCKKRFCKQNEYLLHHMEHSGKIPFECEVCHKKFALKQYLWVHIQAHKKNVKPKLHINPSQDEASTYRRDQTTENKTENDSRQGPPATATGISGQEEPIAETSNADSSLVHTTREFSEVEAMSRHDIEELNSSAVKLEDQMIVPDNAWETNSNDQNGGTDSVQAEVLVPDEKFSIPQAQPAIVIGPFECGACPATFRNGVALAKHERTHLSGIVDGKKYYKCGLCDKKLATFNGLKYHVGLHRANTLPMVSTARFKCKRCHKNFIKKVSLKNHRCDYFGGVKPQVQLAGEEVSRNNRDPAYSATAEPTPPIEQVNTSKAQPNTEGTSYECGACLATFESWGLLAEHEKTHLSRTDGENKYYVCDFCGIEVFSFYRLKHHVKLRHSVAPIRNPSPVHQMDPPPVFQCDVCKKNFKSKYQLPRHRQTQHNGKKLFTFPCEDCDRLFSKKIHVLTHRITAHGFVPPSPSRGPQVFRCDVCNRNFERRRHLDRHRASQHNGKKTFTFPCEDCDRLFAKKIHILPHRIKAHGFWPTAHSQSSTLATKNLGESEPFVTQTVNLQTGTDDQSRDQTRTISSKDTSSSSSSQGGKPAEPSTYQYVSIDDIINRSKSENETPPPKLKPKLPRKFECRGCFQVFGSVRDQQDHEQKNHLISRDGKQFCKCGLCGKELKSDCFRKLYMHKRLNHRTRAASSSSVEFRYQCDVCGQKFGQQLEMIFHRRIHTEVKPHTCDLLRCKIPSPPNNLAKHRSHCEEQPYECSTRNKKFAQRVHTEEKGFSCDICRGIFATHSSLKSHLFSHRKDHIISKIFNSTPASVSVEERNIIMPLESAVQQTGAVGTVPSAMGNDHQQESAKETNSLNKSPENE